MEVVELPNGLGSKLRAVEGLVVGEDWSGTRVERFGTTSTRFEHCRFERMRVKQFTAGGAGRFAEFVDCSFDRSHLSFSPAGRGSCAVRSTGHGWWTSASTPWT